ncbi:MAG: hypothetical protein AVDCRST_MAG59-4334, partial [uncultured Thermomicrobiales bacterium]
ARAIGAAPRPDLGRPQLRRRCPAPGVDHRGGDADPHRVDPRCRLRHRQAPRRVAPPIRGGGGGPRSSGARGRLRPATRRDVASCRHDGVRPGPPVRRGALSRQRDRLRPDRAGSAADGCRVRRAPQPRWRRGRFAVGLPRGVDRRPPRRRVPRPARDQGRPVRRQRTQRTGVDSRLPLPGGGGGERRGLLGAPRAGLVHGRGVPRRVHRGRTHRLLAAKGAGGLRSLRRGAPTTAGRFPRGV